jgi:hypothetical protein
MQILHAVALASGLAIAAAAFPATAQQSQQGPGGMMGPGGPGMMNQGMMGLGTCSMMGGMGPGMMMGWGMMNPATMGMMMGGPAVQGRLAYVKAELGITDAQASAWDGYASAVNAQVTTMQDMHAGMMQAIQSGSAMDRIEAHIKAMEAMVQSLKALKPATAALYAALTDEQKQKADLLLVTGCMM